MRSVESAPGSAPAVSPPSAAGGDRERDSTSYDPIEDALILARSILTYDDAPGNLQGNDVRDVLLAAIVVQQHGILEAFQLIAGSVGEVSNMLSDSPALGMLGGFFGRKPSPTE